MAGKYDALAKSAGSLFNMTDKLIESEPEVREIMVIDPNAPALREDGTLTFKGFELTRIGLKLPADITPDDMSEVGNLIGSMQSATQWLLGDWLNSAASDRMWGDGTYERFAATYNLQPKTLREYAYVCRQIDLSIRMDKLSFAHHQLVAAMDAIEQIKWLNRAQSEKLSVSQMRQAIKGDTTPTPPDATERIERDFVAYRKQLKTIGRAGRAQLRQLAVDLISQIDDMEG